MPRIAPTSALIRSAIPEEEQGPGFLLGLAQTLDIPRKVLFKTLFEDIGGLRLDKHKSGASLLKQLFPSLRQRKGKLDLIDVLGFGTEIVGDPLMLLGGIGTLSKGGRAAAAVTRGLKQSKAARTFGQKAALEIRSLLEAGGRTVSQAAGKPLAKTIPREQLRNFFAQRRATRGTPGRAAFRGEGLRPFIEGTRREAIRKVQEGRKVLDELGITGEARKLGEGFTRQAQLGQRSFLKLGMPFAKPENQRDILRLAPLLAGIGRTAKFTGDITPGFRAAQKLISPSASRTEALQPLAKSLQVSHRFGDESGGNVARMLKERIEKISAEQGIPVEEVMEGITKGRHALGIPEDISKTQARAGRLMASRVVDESQRLTESAVAKNVALRKSQSERLIKKSHELALQKEARAAEASLQGKKSRAATLMEMSKKIGVDARERAIKREALPMGKKAIDLLAANIKGAKIRIGRETEKRFNLEEIGKRKIEALATLRKMDPSSIAVAQEMRISNKGLRQAETAVGATKKDTLELSELQDDLIAYVERIMTPEAKVLVASSKITKQQLEDRIGNVVRGDYKRIDELRGLTIETINDQFRGMGGIDKWFMDDFSKTFPTRAVGSHRAVASATHGAAFLDEFAIRPDPIIARLQEAKITHPQFGVRVEPQAGMLYRSMDVDTFQFRVLDGPGWNPKGKAAAENFGFADPEQILFEFPGTLGRGGPGVHQSGGALENAAPRRIFVSEDLPYGIDGQTPQQTIAALKAKFPGAEVVQVTHRLKGDDVPLSMGHKGVDSVLFSKDLGRSAPTGSVGHVPGGNTISIDEFMKAAGMNRWRGVQVVTGKKGTPEWAGMGIDKELAEEWLGISEKFTAPKEWQKFSNIYDKFLGLTKYHLTQVHPGFQVRNMQTNVWLNFLGGVTNPMAYVRAHRLMKSGGREYQNLVNEGVIKGGRTREVLRELRNDDTAGTIQGFVKDLNKKPAGKYQKSKDWVNKKAAYVEDMSRVAHYLGRKDLGDTTFDAVQSVNKYLLDFSDLTDFEKKFGRRIFLFYNWTRKMLPLMASQYFENPSKMAMLTRTTTQPTIERPEFLPEFIRAQAGIPFGRNEEGNARFLFGTGSPLEDFSKLDISDAGPGKVGKAQAIFRNILSASTPLVQVPAEVVAGEDFFYRKPIMEADRAPELPFGAHKYLPGFREDTLPSGIIRPRADPEVLYMMRKNPFSRYISSLAKAADSRKSLGDKILALGAGLRTQSLDPDVDIPRAKKRHIERLMKDHISAGDVRTFHKMFPTTSGKENPEVQALMERMRQLDAEARARKKLQMAQ